MAMTDADWLDWLRGDAERCVLVEAQSFDIAAGSAVTHYWSTAAYVTGPADAPANTAYEDVLLDVPGVRASLPEALTGRGAVSFGDIELDNAAGDFDVLTQHAWDGRPVNVYLGAPTWSRSDFRLVFGGVVGDITSSGDSLLLQVRDKQAALDVPMLTTAVTGTGSTAGQMVPKCYGRVYNVEPLLVDAATRTYRVHDGAIAGIDVVRVDGDVLNPANYTVTAATGSFVTAYALTGRITCDVRGDAQGGYVETASAIYSRVLLQRGISSGDIDAASLSALASAVPGPVGLYVRDDSTSVLDVLDELMTGVGACYSLTRGGLFAVWQITAPSAGAAVMHLEPDDVFEVSLVRRLLPVTAVRLGWGRNWAPLSSISANVTDVDVRARLAGEYQVARVATTGAAAFLTAAASDVMPSVFAVQADAVAEATRRAALWGSLRRVISVRVSAVVQALSLGQTITLGLDRLGLGPAVPGLIVGLTDGLSAENNEIEVLV